MGSALFKARSIWRRNLGSCYSRSIKNAAIYARQEEIQKQVSARSGNLFDDMRTARPRLDESIAQVF